jgi:hypothetical protein
MSPGEIPDWLNILAIVALVTGAASALVIALDILAGHFQHMWIMNLVWPITGLYAGSLAVWAYFAVGRLSTRDRVRAAKERGEDLPGKRKPFWQMVGVAATHCGAGCTLGDLCAEWIMFAAPLVLFGHRLFGSWLVDFLFAYAFGIAFQYFTIVPMRGLSIGEGLSAAVKADTLSLTAWQVGMYGWMAIAVFLIFGHELEKTDPVFWFMMQVAMLAGFLTAYPVNWWLVSSGIKEKM